MYYGKKIYDKVTKIVKLSAIWVIRILFASNNFKVPFYKKVFYAVYGGFVADQIALYDLNLKNRKEYLSEFDWYKSRYINEPYNFILNNKIVCSDILKQYIKVPTTYFIKIKGKMYSFDGKECSFEDIYNLLKKEKSLYIKPISIGKGIGVNKLSFENNTLFIDYSKVKKHDFEQFLDNRDNWFISESVVQSKELDKLYDKTTNTIRLITVRDKTTNKCKVLYAVQRIGTKDTIPVDNGSKGGLVANIDLDTGVLSSAKSIKKICNYDIHPDSKNPILGIKIENWDNIKKQFVELMEKLPYLYFVAWDVILTSDGPVVIEANTSSGVNIIQVFKPQRDNELGKFYKKHKIIK